MSLSPQIATILASLQPGFPMGQSEHATDEERERCPYCGVTVWRVVTPAGKPLLLNERPDALGRWQMESPGVAIFCAGIRMIAWPLPRYSSHLVDCVELIQARERQREEKAEELRWAKVQRDAARAKQMDRRRRYFEREDAAAAMWGGDA